VGDEEGSADSQIDFHLFNSAEDAFVTVVDKKNGRHSLQLRRISTLQLLNEFLLPF
jgi:hypothetical protein